MKTPSIVIYVLVFLLTAPMAMAEPQQESPQGLQAFAQKLEAGAQVQVQLKDGKKLKGTFVPGSPDAFRLLPKTRTAVPVREIPFNDITSIERKKDGFWSPGKKVLVGVAIGVGVGIVALVAAYGRG